MAVQEIGLSCRNVLSKYIKQWLSLTDTMNGEHNTYLDYRSSIFIGGAHIYAINTT